MALSGSFYGAIVSGHYKLRVDWSATQNAASNTSKITAVMYLVNDWKLSISGRSDNSTTIAGAAHTWASPAINGTGTTKLGAVTSGNITHDADGAKSVTISATYNIRATINGTYYDKITASETITLNTIPRATTPTFHASSVDMGRTLTIYTSRASENFKHDLAYSFAGSDWVAIATDVETWHAWAVPDLATSIPNSASGTMTIRCVTKNGSTIIGTKTGLVTVKVPADVVPTIDNVIISEAVENMASRFSAFVAGKSKVKTTIYATGAKRSTIKSYSTTLAGKTYAGSSWTSDIIGDGPLSMITTVTDSRGRTNQLTTPLNVQPYSPPKVYTFSASRYNADGDPDPSGDRVALRYSYEVSDPGGGNTAEMLIEYKQSTAIQWETLLTGAELAEDTTRVLASPTFSSDYQYDLRLTVTDYFGAFSTYNAILPTGKVIMDFKADGAGVSFGKVCERAGVEVAEDWPVYRGEYSPDYVIDQGTSGIWKYTRWASGKVEAVGRMTVSTAVSSAWGSIYASGPLYDTAVPFPFTFSSVPYVTACLDGNGAGAWLIASGSSSGATTSSVGLYEICRGTSSTAKAYVVILNVVGFI